MHSSLSHELSLTPQLQDAVTTAHETSNAFSDEVLREHAIFELSKKQEMKEMLGKYADGQVEMLQRAMDDWDRVSLLACCGHRRDISLTRRNARVAPQTWLTPDHSPSPAHSSGCVSPAWTITAGTPLLFRIWLKLSLHV